MQEEFDRLIKLVYQRWEDRRPKIEGPHPDEEALACFMENKLSSEERIRLEDHVVNCPRCADIVAVGLSLAGGETKEVPAEILARLKELSGKTGLSCALEIILRFKEKALELLATTGDVLVGQELISAPLLRSRSIKDFQDEVNILKDFKDIRVEAKIENEGGKAFSLSIVARNKQTQKTIKDLRVTLIREGLELESYHSDTGRVTFEHVLLGKYKVEISSAQGQLAAVLLEIKI